MHLCDCVDSYVSHRFKEGHPINFSLSEKHTVTPENDPEQSLYTCKGIRTGRPSYSKTSDSFHTKNLRKYNRGLVVVHFYPANILSHFHSLFFFIWSFEEEGASFHLWFYLLCHHCHFHWMHFPQIHPQTRFPFTFCDFLTTWILKICIIK